MAGRRRWTAKTEPKESVSLCCPEVALIDLGYLFVQVQRSSAHLPDSPHFFHSHLDSAYTLPSPSRPSHLPTALDIPDQARTSPRPQGRLSVSGKDHLHKRTLSAPPAHSGWNLPHQNPIRRPAAPKARPKISGSGAHRNVRLRHRQTFREKQSALESDTRVDQVVRCTMTQRLFWNTFLQTLVLLYLSTSRCHSSYSHFSYFSSDFLTSSRSEGLKDMAVIHGWRSIDFVFPSSSARHAMIRDGSYVPGNGIIIDADYFQNGVEEKILVTLPRLREGIPVTLAKVSSQRCLDGSPKLEPYPDWSWQREDNCEGLVSAFRMKVDECGRLWVIDSGVTDVLHSHRKSCPPKVMVFDLATDHLLMKHVFPEEVLEGGSLLVTIAVDARSRHCRDTFVYVADVTSFALVVLDARTRRSWRVTSNYFYPYPLFGSFNIAGSEFDLMDGVIGLALSPLDKYGDRTLYFHSLASIRESKVSTSLLRNESNFLHGENKVSKKFYITDEVRPSQSAAQDMSESKILFFGLLSPNSIACWNSRLPYLPLNIVTIAQNNETLQFASGVKVVKKNGNEELLVTTSRFPSYFLEKINKREVNFRILSATVEDLVEGTACDYRAHSYRFPESFSAHELNSWK